MGAKQLVTAWPVTRPVTWPAMWALAWVVVSTLAGSAAAQSGRVHVVTQGMNLQTVISGAQAGDTLLVKPGSYPSGAFIGGKGLQIVADTQLGVSITGGVRIQNTPPGQHVVLSGLAVQGEPWSGVGTGVGLRVTNTNGPLRIDHCSFLGTEVGNGAWLLAAADVVANSSAIKGNNSTSWGPIPASNDAGSGLVSSGGKLALFSCNLRGAPGVDADVWADGQHGGRGATVGSWEFYAARTSFTGGPGGRPFGSCTIGGNGGRGLSYGGATVANALGCMFDGGAGALGNNCFCATCLNGHPGQPLVGPVNVIASYTTRLDAPRVAREGQTVVVTITAQPNVRAFLLASLAPAHQFDAAYKGPLLVRAPYVLRMALGPMTSSTIQAQVTLPDLPAGTESETWFLQAFTRSPTSGVHAGEPRSLVILDSAF
jgi:hypothetical protein